jgi:predicted 3-demethylubiquinone-9 3-methyltransferase (glyoxalase superfamily)
MQKITPFLWFNDQAEEAVKFYSKVFKNAKIKTITRYGDAGPGPKGTVMTASIVIEGQEFVALNGGPIFTFTPAISFVVNCRTQAEVDRLWDRLTEGGEPGQCGWLKDKYGVSWQIVPTILTRLLTDRDPVKANRVMQAMLKMDKIDIAALKAAYGRK